MKNPILVTVFALTLASNPLAQAQVIIIADPTTQVTSSTVIIGCCTDRIDDKIVNGSGLSGGLHDVNPSNMWLSAASGFGGIDPDPSMTFDLGAE